MNDIVETLKEIIEKYPSVLNDDKKLKSILKDYFPNDRRIQNQLYMVSEEGILEDMQGTSVVKKFKMLGYIHGLANDYGISETMAQSAILLWTSAFGIEAEDVVVADNSIKKPEKKNNVMDYSDLGVDDIESSGTTIKFSGKETTKIIPGVTLEKTVYIVKAKGAPSVFFYDKNKRREAIIIASEDYEEKMFDATRMDGNNSGIIEVKDAQNNWLVEMIPV